MMVAIELLAPAVGDLLDLLGAVLAELRADAGAVADADPAHCKDAATGDIEPDADTASGATSEGGIDWDVMRFPIRQMAYLHGMAAEAVAARWAAFGDVRRAEMGLEPETVLRAMRPGTLGRLTPALSDPPLPAVRERFDRAVERERWRTEAAELWRYLVLGEE